MFAALEHVFMKIIMIVWVRVSSNSWRGFPYPKGDAVVRAEGPDPYTAVLCGSGIVVGYGVASHELALGGALARGLAAQTQRGAEMTIVTAPGINTRKARARLPLHVLSTTDVIVFSLGTIEILSYMPPHRWGKQLNSLVSDALAAAPQTCQIFLVDCNTPRMSTFPAAYRRRIARSALRFNEELQEIARSHERVHRVEFAPEPEDAENIEGRSRYQEWASKLLPAIIPPLQRPNNDATGS